MRAIKRLPFGLVLAAVSVCWAQQWEIGGVGGFAFPWNRTVTNATGSAKAGFENGAAVGAIAGQNLYSYIGGEMRYTYRFGNLKVSSGGNKATFAAQTHAIHYDLLFYGAPRKARVRPFLAAGGGIKVFRGTGQEHAYQPLSDFALLTKTQEVKGMISVGGGVKAELAPNILMRAEFRDFITPFPKQVITPSPGAKLSGWLHDFVPMVGLTYTF
jgi:hypothetical protein